MKKIVVVLLSILVMGCGLDGRDKYTCCGQASSDAMPKQQDYDIAEEDPTSTTTTTTIVVNVSGCENSPDPNNCDVVSQPDPEEPDVKKAECTFAAHCDDSNPCTYDWCVNGECVNEFGCDEGEKCDQVKGCVMDLKGCPDLDDNDECTYDSCDVYTGKSEHIAIDCGAAVKGTQLEVASWVCDKQSGCLYFFECGNCYDDNPCTIDFCDGATGDCIHDPVVCDNGFKCVMGTCEFFCTADAHCDDNNPCTDDECNPATGACEYVDQICQGGEPGQVGICVSSQFGPGWECQYYWPGCGAPCDDSNPCTADFCDGAQCQLVPLPCGMGTVCNCGPGMPCIATLPSGTCIQDPDECNGKADCDDSNPCTDDSCDMGKCLHDFGGKCPNSQFCVVVNPVTFGCISSEAPDCPDGCDDENPSTIDFCTGPNQCESMDPCGPGTAFDAVSGQCVPAQSDPKCDEGSYICVEMGNTQFVYHAKCMDGAWVFLDNCGKNGGCLAAEGPGIKPDEGCKE